MQTVIPSLIRDQEKLRSKKSRKRLGKWKAQNLREKLQIAKWRHRDYCYHQFSNSFPARRCPYGAGRVRADKTKRNVQSHVNQQYESLKARKVAHVYSTLPQ